MGTVCSTVYCWLAKGASMASDTALWIWEKVTSLFENVCEVVRGLFESFWFCGSYEKEKTWTATAEGREEVGHERIQVQGGLNATPAQPALPSDPSERKRVRDKKKKGIKVAKAALEKLEEIMDEDEEHESIPETEAKLKDFMNSPDYRDLQAFLNSYQTVNPSLW